MLAFALGGAALLRFGPVGALKLTRPIDASFSAPWLFAIPIWIATLAVFGLYNPTRWANAVDEARRITAACLTAPTAFVLGSFFLKTQPSRIWVATGTLAGVACVGLGRRGLRRMAVALRRNGRWSTRTILVGGPQAKRLIDALVLDVGAGMVPVGTCGEVVWGDLPHWRLEEIRGAVTSTKAGAVVVVARDIEHEAVQRIVAVADDLPVSVLVVPGIDYTLVHNLQVVPVGNEPALSVEFPSLRRYQQVMKRAFDLALSVPALLAALPVLASLAIAIRLDSPGPILFRQRRVGLRGKEFNVLKFRTMVLDAHELKVDYHEQNEAGGLLFKMRDDPRITGVGRFLRRFSLDELPQLWNVIRGEMSIVGPRPALSEEVEQYEVPLRRRLNVRPGLTGMWQISGRSDLAFEDYVRLDLTYVQNWGVLLDLYILLRTAPAVLGGKGAY